MLQLLQNRRVGIETLDHADHIEKTREKVICHLPYQFVMHAAGCIQQCQKTIVRRIGKILVAHSGWTDHVARLLDECPLGNVRTGIKKSQCRLFNGEIRTGQGVTDGHSLSIALWLSELLAWHTNYVMTDSMYNHIRSGD